MMTIWDLQSHRLWDKFHKLCVGSTSLSCQGTFLEEQPILWIGRIYPCPSPGVEGIVTSNFMSWFCPKTRPIKTWRYENVTI
jgi:hypothetical protein